MASNETGLRLYERNFGHCIILWEIENFSLALCNSRMVIATGEFTVSSLKATRWQIGVCLELENSSVLKAFLKRVEDEVDEPVKVSWKVKILNGKGEGAIIQEQKECYISSNSKNMLDLSPLRDILQILPAGEPDKLRFSFQMIVFMNTTMIIPTPDNECLNSLVSDMEVVAKTGLHSDVVAVLNGATMNVHKAILCPRSEKLAKSAGVRGRKKFGVPFGDNEAVSKLFYYLYTGDLKYILNPPSISVYDCIMYFDIKELRNSYPQEKISMKTTIEAKQFEFRWSVLDFINMDTPQESEIYEADGMDFSWQLCIYPKGLVGGSEMQKKYVYIEALAVKGVGDREYQDLFIDFIAKNDRGEIPVVKRAYGKVIAGKKLGVLFMRIDGYPMSKAVVGGNLDLYFSIHVATGNVNFEVTETRPPVPFNLTNFDTYKILTNYMGVLQTGRIYCDIILKVQNTEFHTHKFLLAGRSKRLSEMIGGPPNYTSFLILSIKNQHLFRVFLDYLYTGALTDLNAYTLMNVYELGNSYLVESLKPECLKYLEAQLRPDNSCHMLLFAHERILTELKTAVLQYISAYRDFVVRFQCWTDLERKDPDLFYDVIYFLGNNPIQFAQPPLPSLVVIPEVLEETCEAITETIQESEETCEARTETI